MRKHLKNYFVPHEDNDHKPHMLRGVSVAVLALMAVVAFAFSAFHSAILLQESDFLAAILPGVLVDLANEDRADNALLPLTPNSLLEQAAQLKADHMAELGYFAHESPDGVTPWDWFIEVGYQFTYAGENLAVNFTDSEDVEDAWMNSPGHRANILNDSFTEIGIATARGEYEGQNTIFVVQMFGRPAVAQTPTPSPQVAEAATEAPEPGPAEVPSEEENAAEVESEEPAPITEPELEVVVETPTFVAVQDTTQTQETTENEIINRPVEEGQTTDSEALGAGATGLTGNQATFWEELITQPHRILNWLYLIFAGILVLVLTATILIEIEKQHPKHIFYGILLLVLLVVLTYLFREAILPELLIV